MNGGRKGRQETVSGPKGVGEKTSGVEQTHKDKTGHGNGKKGTRREKRSRNDGERTIDESRVDIETKERLENRIMERVWILHGRAQEAINSRTTMY